MLDAIDALADSQQMETLERITIDPARRSGKPCIRDTRIAVYDVLDYLASGMSEEEILNDFPELDAEDIRASLAFAAARERRLFGAA
ncbi:DUF433 domain-containing protein [Mesorhizobium marinum]|uniref:DUF433 domain-containing protein n=1 Tax=Mesorhizobium marinum TaxID=3228790 RepID=UPI003F5C2F63